MQFDKRYHIKDRIKILHAKIKVKKAHVDSLNHLIEKEDDDVQLKSLKLECEKLQNKIEYMFTLIKNLEAELHKH